ncbi:hypothetical protein NQ317_000398 [Molorchus minor]|uniref:Uncharacterized protein n=1 Tax=Molorchus minor TaxID=1323400 RepID=A0ABQ9IQQ3_9CUCU|nr:hypothetical protein NQ317_000398 [Molorchus minor]
MNRGKLLVRLALQKEVSPRIRNDGHWCNDVSSLANKNMNDKKWEKPKLVPLTEDVKCFNNYVTTTAAQAYTKLKNKEDIASNYKLTEDVYQTAKVAKVLLLLNGGKGNEFKGKSLNDIEVTHDVLDTDEIENENAVTAADTNNLEDQPCHNMKTYKDLPRLQKLKQTV